MARKFSGLRFPKFKESLAIAATVALIGFFSMNVYYPPLGVMGNAMNGHIVITDTCPPDPIGMVGLDAPAPKPFLCGLDIPYRWVLIVLVIFVAGCGFWERRKKSV